MRNSIKLSILTSLFLLTFSIASIHATTITWLGGNAAWDDASQWDTGIVPGIGDDVIISSGRVKIYNGDNEHARSVYVQSVSARLYIYEGGTLEISGAVDNDGLHNKGRVFIYGNLFINDITQTNPNVSAKAINNDLYIFTYPNSQVNIKYIDDIGIHNSSFSYFRVKGGLWIYQTVKGAISNHDRFYNSGLIDIIDCGLPSSYTLSTADDFRNYSTGEIYISSSNYSAFDVSNSLKNYGSIEVENTTIGFNNAGSISNYEGAYLDADYCGIGYYNRPGKTISNSGSMKTNHTLEGVNNYGTIYNYRHIGLFYSNSNGGLRNMSGGVIENFSDIYVLGSGARDVNNEGVINNKGILETSKIIDIASTGSLINDGFLVSHYDGTHLISGTLENRGAIDDNYGMLQQSPVINDRLIIAPVAGPMFKGVPFPNVLDVVSFEGLTLGDWKISQNGISAGIYDPSTNEFTPNGDAIGISTIYISVNDEDGLSRNFSLEIEGGIISFDSEDPMFFAEKETSVSINEELHEVVAFPNPSNGSVQLESKMFEENQTQVQVFNTLGQLVQEVQLEAGNFNQMINLSSRLVSGIYVLKMIQKGEEVNVQRIQLQR